MNILLDAYFDSNYGDDIFIKGITSVFSSHKFYAFLEHYPEKIVRWADGIPNLFPLPENDLFLDKKMFDAYICVGGDIFPDGGDFSKRKAYIDSVKSIGGTVAFLGFSMFHSYSEETRRDIFEMMSKADIISPRDSESVKILKSIIPEKEIEYMADLAFSTCLIPESENKSSFDVMGISARKPGSSDEETYKKYTASLAEAVNSYLGGKDVRRVVLFGLSDGINSDKEVTEDILSMVSDTERVDTVMYGGDTDAVKTEFSKCSFVICTRFHAIVTCLSMNIPFIPVSYEVKTEHLLEDIGYKGVRFDYKEMAGLAEAVEKIASDTDSSVAPDLYDKDMFNEYISGSGRKLSELKEKLNAPAYTDAISKEFDTESSYTEVIYGKKEGEIVTRRKAREKEILDAMDSYVSTIEKLKADVEEHVETINKLNDENKGLFTQIEEANDRNSELFKTIEEINARNAEYFKIIEEVNARNAECNKTIEELNAKLDLRPAFLKNLKKNKS